MSTAEDNVELVEKGYAAFSTGDLDALGAVMAPDVVHRAPGNNLTSGEYRGQEELFGFYGKLFELSDGTFNIELVSAEPKGDDQVIARHRGGGTRNGRTYEGTSTIVFTIVDGKATLLDETHDDQAAVDDLWS
jgi:ketosteroid isomerase-like protein